jgi:hypothetical protein
MKVELERESNGGQKFVYAMANDRTNNPKVIREWIAMLKLAASWLEKKAGEQK